LLLRRKPCLLLFGEYIQAAKSQVRRQYPKTKYQKYQSLERYLQPPSCHCRGSLLSTIDLFDLRREKCGTTITIIRFPIVRLLGRSLSQPFAAFRRLLKSSAIEELSSASPHWMRNSRCSNVQFNAFRRSPVRSDILIQPRKARRGLSHSGYINPGISALPFFFFPYPATTRSSETKTPVLDSDLD
jgi:hypothetical protein